MVPLLGAEARDLLVENPFAFLLTVDRRVRVEVMGLARRTNAGKSEIAGSTTPETQRIFPAWEGKTTPLGESASLRELQVRLHVRVSVVHVGWAVGHIGCKLRYSRLERFSQRAYILASCPGCLQGLGY